MAATRSLRFSAWFGRLGSRSKSLNPYSLTCTVEQRTSRPSPRNHNWPATRYFASGRVQRSSGQVVSCTSSANPGDRGTTATVTIQNAARLNSLDRSTLVELRDTFRSLSNDTSLRSVILTSETSPTKVAAFSGGANIYQMAQISSSNEARAFITQIHEVNSAIRELPAVVIARIHGITFGAGLEIAASCDFRLATEMSSFSMPEVKLGLPSVVEARLLANLIGWQETRRMVMLAETYSAQRAQEIGLLDGCFSTVEQLDEEVQRFTDIVASHGPKSMRSQKRLNKIWEENDLMTGIKASIDAFAETYEDGGSEPKEYMKVFTERKRSR